MIWETIVGERDASFNHVSTGGYNAVLECVSSAHPLRSKILSYYNSMVTSVQNVRTDVVEEVLVLFGESISCPLTCTRLDTVGDIARIRTHCTKSRIFRGQAFPTVHIVEIAVSPFAVVIGISASGIIDEVHIGFD